MEGASDRFVRTAVEPLAGDAEVFALAQSELGERVAEAGTSEEALDAARQRLEMVDQGGGARRRRLVRRVVMGVMLGLETEVQRLEPVVDGLQAIREAVENRRKHGGASEELIVRHAGMMAGLTLPMLSTVGGEVTAPTMETLEPGRMAEYALFDQLVAGAMVLLCGLVMLACWWFMAVRTRGLRRLGERLEGLLELSDWAWIGLLGVVLPAAGYFLLAKWGPTSGREFGPRLTIFLVPAVQAACLPALIWLSLIQTVRWRLRKRGGMVGFGAGRSWPGWMVAALCLVAVGLPGLALQIPGSGPWFLWVSAGLAGVALIWVVVVAGRALFGRGRLALERQVAGFAILPALALTALVFAGALPLLEREEWQWVARDELMRTDPERPAMTAYEWEVTQAARKELQGVLE